MELENHNSIPFLDVLISRKEDVSLEHQVFHKKTYSEQYFHANYHHYFNIKRKNYLKYLRSGRLINPWKRRGLDFWILI
jgi:hypothetical protein